MGKTRVYMLIVGVMIYCTTFAQKEDYNWLCGRGAHIEEATKNQFIFNPQLQEIDSFRQDLANFYRTNASISDTTGNSLLYTNGREIFNANHEIILNGDSLSPGYIRNSNGPFLDYTVPQGCLFLPNPYEDSVYHLFHLRGDTIFSPSVNPSYLGIRDLLHTKIVVGKSNIYTEFKNEILINDTLLAGNLSACRHGNGVDWWIVSSETFSNCIYLYLLNDTGVHFYDKICQGTYDDQNSYGFSTFSPNGRYFVKGMSQRGLDIFKFNRCEGTLELLEHIPKDNFVKPTADLFAFIGRNVFSSNSQYLYYGPSDSTYRVDMYASNIVASQTLVRDAYQDSIAGFTSTLLGPDGKIYAHRGSNASYNLLHNPNEPNPDLLDFEMIIPLPNDGSHSFGNFPNFRLGSAEETPCDTIINIEEVFESVSLGVFPNPSRSLVTIDYGSINWRENTKASLQIVNGIGQTVWHMQLPEYSAVQYVSIEKLPQGMYYVQLLDNKVIIGSTKLVKY